MIVTLTGSEDLKTMVDVIHRNAVEHGFWDRTEILHKYMLVICELAETVEELRSGNMDVWYGCVEGNPFCAPYKSCGEFSKDGGIHCPSRKKKPEGVVIELTDAAIRILDLMGESMVYPNEELLSGEPRQEPMRISEREETVITNALSASLKVSKAAMVVKITGKDPAQELEEPLHVIWKTILALGHDPKEMIALKHNYNVSRPIRHGKLF